MKPIDRIVSFSERAKVQHKAYILNLASVLYQTLDSIAPTSPKARYDYEQKALVLAGEMLAQEGVLIREVVESLVEQATDGIRLSSQDSASIREASDFAVREALSALSAQAKRDINVPSGVLMRLAIETNMLSRAGNATHVDALLRMKKKFGGELLNFMFVDRSGRRWDSTRYVQTLIHSLLLNVYNEAVMFALATQGINQARVESPKKGFNGMRFRFVENNIEGVLPIYSEIKDLVFHPNSLSIIVPE